MPSSRALCRIAPKPYNVRWPLDTWTSVQVLVRQSWVTITRTQIQKLHQHLVHEVLKQFKLLNIELLQDGDVVADFPVTGNHEGMGGLGFRGLSLFARHTAHVARPTYHATRHTPHATHRTSHIALARHIIMFLFSSQLDRCHLMTYAVKVSWFTTLTCGRMVFRQHRRWTPRTLQELAVLLKRCCPFCS